MNIDKLLKERGKTRYWLAKNVNITYPTIKRLAENTAEKVTLEIIYNMVKVLECDFNDLFMKNEKDEEV